MSQTELTIETCANCTAILIGAHCHECGQKKFNPNELSIKRFVARTIGDITDIESSKSVKTLIAMIARPGVLAMEYLAGRRGNYIGPIKLYLTFSALYFLFAWGALAEIRGGATDRTARTPFVVNVARKRGVDPSVLADKIHQKAEKYSTVLRFFSVLISGAFLALFYFRSRKYYVEHLVFSLYYYSFDFLCKCLFALVFMGTAFVKVKLPEQALNVFYPIAFCYLLLALKMVYKQKWLITSVKALFLFLCETALFMGSIMAGFIIAFSTI